MAKLRSLLHSILRTPPSPTSLSLIQVEGSTLVQIAEAKTKRMGCFPFSSCLLGPQRGCTAAKGQIQTLMHARSLSLSLSPPLSLSSVGTRHTHGAQTYMQTLHTHTETKHVRIDVVGKACDPTILKVERPEEQAFRVTLDSTVSSMPATTVSLAWVQVPAPCDGPQCFLTPVPGNLMCSCDLHGHQALRFLQAQH